MWKLLGVDYISYHACPNDCILYKNKYADKEICPKCGHERYHKQKLMQEHPHLDQASQRAEKEHTAGPASKS
jgi:hypothetical protein